ncbi:NAD-dependent epimerase/dehydratase family protein [Litoribrevibacter albus]|uniref:NAD(P)-dependent oxidoreductase n=1 Tax=Litoribrevibacter albus TaxID=1473156 RepID=A0AA37W989_9GAMM|nr:NAD-dependent epimerase/dehydratase family protein [Litoribrevibacter albus]GLQ33014.1 NAD(P)-dependent oxidoreductase [Litoribrevibacter albus]
MAAPLSVLIAGFGDIGHRIADALTEAAKETQQPLALHAIRRSPEQHKTVQVLNWDMQSPAISLPAVDYVIFCVSADQLTEAGYQASYIDAQQQLINALIEQQIPVAHYFFCSSTSVYGQTQHEWVDESSTTEPTRFTGKKMLDAEAVAESSPWPTTAIRATGLYGPGRTRMIGQVLSGKVAEPEPVCYSNRIHVDDLARFYAHLILQHHQHKMPLAPVYLACDDEPVAIHEVQKWMAKQLNVEITERIAAGRTGSKRISNKLMKSTGFQFHYPSYKDGMPTLLAAI